METQHNTQQQKEKNGEVHIFEIPDAKKRRLARERAERLANDPHLNKTLILPDIQLQTETIVDDKTKLNVLQKKTDRDDQHLSLPINPEHYSHPSQFPETVKSHPDNIGPDQLSKTVFSQNTHTGGFQPHDNNKHKRAQNPDDNTDNLSKRKKTSTFEQRAESETDEKEEEETEEGD